MNKLLTFFPLVFEIEFKVQKCVILIIFLIPESLVAHIKPTPKNLNLNKIREEYAFNRFF